MTRTDLPRRLTGFGLLLFASTIPISHVPAQFGIGLAVIGWLLEGWLNGNWQLRWNLFLLPLVLYWIWNIISAASSPRALHSLAAIADNEWAMFVMLMMYWTITDSHELTRILVCWFVSSTVAMVYAIWQTFYGVEVYRHMTLDPMGQFHRSVGFYGFYLTFAAFAMTVFFVSLAFALENRSKGRQWAMVLPLLSFISVLFTFARSIWFAVAGVIPFLGFVRGKKKDWLASFVVLLVFIVSLLLVPTLRYRAMSIFDLKANQTRINLWETSMNISRDFRFIGIGEDNFDYYFERYKVAGYYDTTAHPHNDYLNVLINAGVPGLVFFLWMWFLALKSGVKTWRRAKDKVIRSAALGGTLSLVGLMIGSMFQDYYGSFINCLGWWFIVGLIMSGTGIQERREEECAEGKISLPQITT